MDYGPERENLKLSESWKEKQIYLCEICGNPGRHLHHLIPRWMTTRLRIAECRTLIRTCYKCEEDIHFYISHWELGTKFNTRERIREELRNRRKLDTYYEEKD